MEEANNLVISALEHDPAGVLLCCSAFNGGSGLQALA